MSEEEIVEYIIPELKSALIPYETNSLTNNDEPSYVYTGHYISGLRICFWKNDITNVINVYKYDRNNCFRCLSELRRILSEDENKLLEPYMELLLSIY